MKIATKFSMTALAAVLCLGMAQYATAESPAASKTGIDIDLSGGKTSVNVAAAPASENASVNVATTAVKTDSVAIKVPEVATEAPSKPEKKVEKKSKKDSIELDMEMGDGDGVPSSVKDVVERLQTATEDVTLEDLNAAREAIVKLDVLIDIEKRLNDLATIKKEREDKDSTMAAALPTTSLAVAPPPAFSAVPMSAPPVSQPAAMPHQAISSSADKIKVSRIVGASGSYVANITDADGSEKRVRAGDKLGDGAVVSSISRNGVTVKESGGKTLTVQVKDVNTVFNGR